MNAKTSQNTSTGLVTLKLSASLDLADRAFENGCLDGATDWRWRRLREAQGSSRLHDVRPVPNIDGIPFNQRQQAAIKAYKVGYVMTSGVWSF